MLFFQKVSSISLIALMLLSGFLSGCSLTSEGAKVESACIVSTDETQDFNLMKPRAFPLDKNKILLIPGGIISTSQSAQAMDKAGLLIYDLEKKSVSQGPSTSIKWHMHDLNAVRLTDGRIMVLGVKPKTNADHREMFRLQEEAEKKGIDIENSPELKEKMLKLYGKKWESDILDTTQMRFNKGPTLNMTYDEFTITSLPNGDALVFGSEIISDGLNKYQAELFLANENRFKVIENPFGNRGGHHAIRLDNGDVLIIGGVHYFETDEPPNRVLRFNAKESKFESVGFLKRMYSNATATLLPNGKVLVVGPGFPTKKFKDDYFGIPEEDRPYYIAEVFDPTTGESQIVGPMITPRQEHTATLMDNGNVLLAGGFSFKDERYHKPLNTTELFDYRTNTFHAGPTLAEARVGHTAIIVNNKILLLGGGFMKKVPLVTVIESCASSEASKPLNAVKERLPKKESENSNIVTEKYLDIDRFGAALINDNQILITPGNVSNPSDPLGLTAFRADSYIFDLKKNQLSVGPDRMGAYRDHPELINLDENTIMFLGGDAQKPDKPEDSYPEYNPKPTELYNIEKRKFLEGPALNYGRKWHTTTRLKNGDLLIYGGQSFEDPEFIPELYDYSEKEFVRLNSPFSRRFNHKATLLPNGDVIILGGMVPHKSDEPESLVIRFNTKNQTFEKAGYTKQHFLDHTMTTLPNGKVLIVGRALPTEHAKDAFMQIPPEQRRNYNAEVFDPKTGQSVIVGPMINPRQHHSATLLPDGRVILVGGNQEKKKVEKRYRNTFNKTTEYFDYKINTFTPGPSLMHYRSGHKAFLIGDKLLILGGGVYDQKAPFVEWLNITE